MADTDTVLASDPSAVMSRMLRGFQLSQAVYVVAELRHSVRAGRPGAEEYLGEPFFDWLEHDPHREAPFSRAMADITASRRRGLVEAYRLPPGRRVADLGGSDGSLLVELLRHDDDTERRGIVFVGSCVPGARGRPTQMSRVKRGHERMGHSGRSCRWRSPWRGPRATEAALLSRPTPRR